MSPTRDGRVAGRQRAALPRPAVAAMRTWLMAIDELTAAVNSATPLGVLLDKVAVTACRLLTYESCAVLLADDDRAALRIRGHHGLQAEYVQLVNGDAPLLLSGGTDLSDSPSRRAFTTDTPVVVPDVASDSTFGPWHRAALEQGYRAMAALPLRSRGQVIGTVNVYSSTPHQLDPAGLELLQVLANHAGIALETTALLDRDRARVAELTRLTEFLQRQTTLLQRADEIHQRLTVEAISGGVRSIAEALAALLARPVAVEDADARPLVSVAHAGQEVPLPPVDRRSGLDWDERAVHSSAPVLGPVVFEDLTVTAVTLDEEVAGLLWLPREPEWGELERRAVEQAAVVLALELVRRRAAAEAVWRVGGDLVTDLISGAGLDTDHARYLAERLGADLRLPHAVLVLRPERPDPRRTAHATRAVSAAAQTRQRPRPLATSREGEVVVLLPDPPDSTLAAVAEHLRATAAACTGGLRAALSAPCTDLCELPGALRLSRALLDLTPPAADEGVLTRSSAGLVGLLLTQVDTGQVGSFLDRWLAPLQRYDERRGTELVRTLRTHLDHDLNTAATARALFVHSNTVTLRTRRIEAVLDVSLARVQDLTSLRTALLIDALRQRPA
ncbi:helix-turn-helix domain-containing protein [Modestobacter sp. I12A-02662]|uniref:helix-turn-helix domain-containing protein n=1 Tax=Modestobacter sp. I12A-02662 TaxID=1730496 RepID=UPI0034DF0348